MASETETGSINPSQIVEEEEEEEQYSSQFTESSSDSEADKYSNAEVAAAMKRVRDEKKAVERAKKKELRKIEKVMKFTYLPQRIMLELSLEKINSLEKTWE